MPPIEDAAIVLRPHEVETLRQVWLEARADQSSGLDPDSVFDELDSKYRALVESVGEAA